MRKLFINVLVLSALLTVPYVSLKAQESRIEAETTFFDSLYDVPVMEGLIEMVEQSMSFDKLEGRLAYATALGQNVSQQSVLTFYGQVLPQMGWRQSTPSSFIREKDKLDISYEKTNTYEGFDAVFRFTLSPVVQ